MIIDRPTSCDVPALRALWREAFGDGEKFLDNFFGTAYSPERARVLRLDGEIAGVLYWFDCETCGAKCAYIYAVATKAGYRGRGVCKALMGDLHGHLSERGYALAILVPGSEELFEFYGKMGYTVCSSVKNVDAVAAESACSIRSIDKAEYARLRRKHLPHLGVVQENENMDFLATQATLYAGDDFVLAARVDVDNVFGIELLGDVSAARAGEIVRAFGASRGSFRTYGEGQPFAMCLPLYGGTGRLR